MKLSIVLRILLLAGFIQHSVVWPCVAEETNTPLLTALSSTVISGYVDSSAVWNPNLNNAKGHSAAVGYQQSGIEGQTQIFIGSVVLPQPGTPPYGLPIDPLPIPTGHALLVYIYTEDFKLLGIVDSDIDGHFKIPLKPGTYLLIPRPPSTFPAGRWSFSGIRTVVVTKKEYVSAYFLGIYNQSTFGF
ncbi:MAG TPA: hypothetical protein VK476_02895 [Flavobacterium sp.]|nr:hypothetical protein [Flavobacterium sp.]